MILAHPQDALHKVWLLRVLTAITDDPYLVSQLRFKGRSYAALRNILPRFSVDLDFDLLSCEEIPKTRKHLEQIFRKFELKIENQSQKVPQYFLKYHNKPHARNTLRLDITCPPPKSNEYEPVRIVEIDRILYGHTIPTLFANKLVAPLDRFEKHGSVASRDMYDLHSFFLSGFKYKPAIIEERTGLSIKKFFRKLIQFVETHFTQTIIDQDLNTLLPSREFQKIRSILKNEILVMLKANSIESTERSKEFR